MLLLGLLMSMTSLSVDLYLPSLPAVGRDLSAGAGAMQLTLTAFFAGLAAGQLFYGTLSDRFGRMMPLVFGLLLYIAASMACALATDVVALVALRFVQALGACAAAVLARAIVRDLLTLESLGPTFSVLMFIMGVYASASAHLFIETYGISAQVYAWIYGACAAGSMLASRLNRSLLRSIALPRAMMIGLAINLSSALALMGLATSAPDNLAGLLVPLFLLVASNGLVLPNATAAALMNQQERAGSAAALLGVTQFVSGELVASLYAVLLQVSAPSMAATILACSVAALAGYWLLVRATPASPLLQ